MTTNVLPTDKTLRVVKLPGVEPDFDYIDQHFAWVKPESGVAGADVYRITGNGSCWHIDRIGYVDGEALQPIPFSGVIAGLSYSPDGEIDVVLS